MAQTKLNLAEVFQSAGKEAQQEMLQHIVDAYLRGAITSGSASARP